MRDHNALRTVVKIRVKLCVKRRFCHQLLKPTFLESGYPKDRTKLSQHVKSGFIRSNCISHES